MRVGNCGHGRQSVEPYDGPGICTVVRGKAVPLCPSYSPLRARSRAGLRPSTGHPDVKYDTHTHTHTQQAQALQNYLRFAVVKAGSWKASAAAKGVGWFIHK